MNFLMSEARTLKEALYNTVHRHGRLKVEQIAEQLDIQPNYLYRSVSPDPDIDGKSASGARFMIKLLIPLIRATNDYQALDFIERTLGRVAVPIPSPGRCSIKCLQDDAINAAAEFGELMQEVRESLVDGELTTTERERIHSEGHEAIQAIMQLIIACER